MSAADRDTTVTTGMSLSKGPLKLLRCHTIPLETPSSVALDAGN